VETRDAESLEADAGAQVQTAQAAAIYASATQEVKQSTMTAKEKSEVRSRTPAPHKAPNQPTHTP
jgi:hypothetical protein